MQQLKESVLKTMFGTLWPPRLNEESSWLSMYLLVFRHISNSAASELYHGQLHQCSEYLPTHTLHSLHSPKPLAFIDFCPLDPKAYLWLHPKLNHPSLLLHSSMLLTVFLAPGLAHCSLSTNQPGRMTLKWKVHYFLSSLPPSLPLWNMMKFPL